MITGNKQKFSVKISTFTNNTLYIELYPIHCTDVTFTITVEVLLCNVTFQHEMKNEVLNPIKPCNSVWQSHRLIACYFCY